MKKRHYSEDEARDTAFKIGISWDDAKFDIKQFAMGMNVEAEHGKNDLETNVSNDDPIVTGKIARAHLKEISDYYDRLARMEKAGKK